MADSTATTTAREERRRRKAAEENAADKMASKQIENVESLLELQVGIASENLNVSSVEDGSGSEASVRTYNVNRKSDQETYNIVKSEDMREVRPVPAPRRTKSSPQTAEKISSDTDRDVAELDLDDLSARNKSDTDSKSVKLIKPPPREAVTSGSDESVVIPVPKPRKRIQVSWNEHASMSLVAPETDEKPENTCQEKKASSEEEQDVKSDGSPQTPSPKSVDAQLPVLEPLEYSLKSEQEIRETVIKQKKLRIVDLVDKKSAGKKAKKNKSGKIFSSLIKLEKGKIPKIASILKDLKESEKKEPDEGEGQAGPEREPKGADTEDEENDSADFQIDSPRYTESVQNGQIYVQDKTGFYVMEREEVLKGGSERDKNAGNDRTMADSTVKTAIFFQKYWSRTMVYFHGILAGFAFGHTAMVTAIVMHFNYDPKGFIDIYSRLSLKIHYIFYTLTTFCIVSCFDRVDVGHINRKHWRNAWRVPSMWAVLFIYILSFGLTFANQKTQARFDAYSYISGNNTDEKIWDTKVPGEIQVGFLTWFHTVWARDILLLIAWFIISLTKFTDFLCGHLNNMIKYSNINMDGKL